MQRLRRLSTVLAGLSSGALAVLACSESADPLQLEPSVDAAPSPPSSNDAGVVSETSVRDAADARPPFDPTEETVTCTTEPCPVRIVAGQNHFCVLMSDKSVRCWGGNDKGTLGGGKVDGLANVVQLSAAALTTCALLEDGSVSCWGANDFGQLGLAVDPPVVDWDDHPTPSPVDLSGGRATRVDVGQRSACAVLESGDAVCWGDNEWGQLARSRDFWNGGPAKLEGLSGKTTRTAAGTHTAFAIDDQGVLSSWGAVAGAEGSAAGRVASSTPDLHPATLFGGPFTSFAVSSTYIYWPQSPNPYESLPPEGIGHACGVVSGVLHCWGESRVGAMGVGVPGLIVFPTAVVTRGLAYPQQVAVSRENTCARFTDGTVQCTGDNTHGQLGRAGAAGLFVDYFALADGFTKHAVQVAVSDDAVCALVQGGTVSCWGGNSHGELGQGTTDEAPHPQPVSVVF
ncbi:MAG: hypothetical protein K0S65_6092 [Labilithrix sp.]|nr:hypothetical protein [Labilithrix sp.]